MLSLIKVTIIMLSALTRVSESLYRGWMQGVY